MVHGKKEIMRSVYEGLALSLRDCLSNLPETGETLTVCGGGSVSDLLCTIIADCTGRTVCRSPWKEAGIKGMSDILHQILGSKETQLFRGESSFSGYESFTPSKEHTVLYDHLYESYEQLKSGMEHFWSDR